MAFFFSLSLQNFSNLDGKEMSTSHWIGIIDLEPDGQTEEWEEEVKIYVSALLGALRQIRLSVHPISRFEMSENKTDLFHKSILKLYLLQVFWQQAMYRGKDFSSACLLDFGKEIPTSPASCCSKPCSQ